MKEIEKFYQSLMQDVVAMQSGDEEGQHSRADFYSNMLGYAG